MNRAENEVLEYALGELFGAPTTDLPERVLQALRRGAEGAGERHPQGSAVRRVAWVSAAAAVLVSAIWIGGQLRPDRPVAIALVATADGDLGVLRPGDDDQERRSTFRWGETLVNGPERERRVSLPAGDALTLGRCAMLTLTEDEHGPLLVPRLGRATFEAVGPAALRVRTDLGTLVLEAPATVEVDLRLEGYDLEHPEQFQQLAQELHMNPTLPLIMTVATLVSGHATLETPTGGRELRPGESLRFQEPEVSAKLVESKLLEEVGTWDVIVTSFDRDGERGAEVAGVEVSRAGPGGKWLLTELNVRQGEREVALHTVIGYEAGRRRYTGSLVDSFGGEIGLLKGDPQADLEVRTLQMYSAEGTPGFDARWRMRWESPDRRRTAVEALVDEEWILVREIVHERRP